MLNLYSVLVKNENSSQALNSGEKTAVLYHDLFDYPLSFSELIKWRVADSAKTLNLGCRTLSRRGYYFLGGREGLIYKHLLRKRISAKKMAIAKKAAKVLSYLPGIKMVAVTGSLAMQNSSEESDIDLMIVTKTGSLWTTRLFVYLSFIICHLSFRRPFDGSQKDKLCLNMWLDESDLVWPQNDRNLYTAHEIAQIVPLVNKDRTYEKFLLKNKWILGFWPNSVKIVNCKLKIEISTPNLLEKVCYWIQYQYMKKKVSREVITPTRALFHPQDWGKIVLSRLSY